MSQWFSSHYIVTAFDASIRKRHSHMIKIGYADNITNLMQIATKGFFKFLNFNDVSMQNNFLLSLIKLSKLVGLIHSIRRHWFIARFVVKLVGMESFEGAAVLWFPLNKGEISILNKLISKKRQVFVLS